MTSVDHGREPCPHRIFDDIGGAFAMGAVGGGAVNLVKGIYNAPIGRRFPNGLDAISSGNGLCDFQAITKALFGLVSMKPVRVFSKSS